MFRKAMTAQINYLFANDVDNADELVNKDIKSVSIDGTTVTNNSSVNDTNSNGISNLALEYLVQTGLLFIYWLCLILYAHIQTFFCII